MATGPSPPVGRAARRQPGGAARRQPEDRAPGAGHDRRERTRLVGTRRDVMDVIREHEVEPMAPPPLAVVTATDRARIDGFDDLFHAERVPMTRLAYLLVGSEAVAEEVVQEDRKSVV